MAKTSGPLFSMDASGAFAGALVFTKWKGRPVVRQLVTPANPNSQGQEDSRNMVRVGGAAQRFANLNEDFGAGRTETDKALLMAAAPSGYAWNGNFVKAIIGAGGVNFDAAETAWTALTGGNHTTWDTAAAALTPPISAVAQTEEGGSSIAAMSAGKVWFHYQWGLSVLGIAATPGAVPPTYA